MSSIMGDATMYSYKVMYMQDCEWRQAGFNAYWPTLELAKKKAKTLSNGACVVGVFSRDDEHDLLYVYIDGEQYEYVVDYTGNAELD